MITIIFKGEADSHHSSCEPTNRLSKAAWIEKFGRAEIERDNLNVVPCHCSELFCHGWQVVRPGGTPYNPTEPRLSTKA